LCAILHAVGDGEIQAAVSNNFLPKLHVGSFHSNDDRDGQMQFFSGGDDTGGEDVAAKDAAKNIDKHRLHGGIAHQDAKRILNLVGGSAAADVEKVRG
jgi:hypothetical protein